jgi:hypothetical protein
MRHGAGMGSTLTFHGQDADVELGDGTITFVAHPAPAADEATATAGDDTSAATGGTDTGDEQPVVIARSEVAGVQLTGASLLAYGRLVISTRGGEEHTVRFAREEQEHFENLEAIIRP